MFLADISIQADGESDVVALLKVFAGFMAIAFIFGFMVGTVIEGIRNRRKNR